MRYPYPLALQVWLQHPLLKGDPEVCTPDEVGFPIGVNGMDIGPDGALYVAVTDRATVLRIARHEDGSPGTVEPLLTTDCEHLEGADGLLAEADALLVAVNRTDQLVQLSSTSRAQYD